MDTHARQIETRHARYPPAGPMRHWGDIGPHGPHGQESGPLWRSGNLARMETLRPGPCSSGQTQRPRKKEPAREGCASHKDRLPHNAIDALVKVNNECLFGFIWLAVDRAGSLCSCS